MAQPKKLTNEDLRYWLDQGCTQEEIARMFHMTQPSVSERVEALERLAYAKAPENAVQAVASMWDTKKASEENYQRAVLAYQSAQESKEKVQAIGEIRKHLEFGLAVLSKLYEVQEVQAFMEEVTKVIEECDPAMKEKILARLRERRAIRAAFIQH